jgi:hypothetical protein
MLELHAKSPITGRYEVLITLSGSEDEWESFIHRVQKTLAS